MSRVNPYQPPATHSKPASIPVRLCPHCSAEVTFRNMLVQFSPWQYQCPPCGSVSRVRIPHLPWIYLGTILVFLIMGTILAFLIAAPGLYFGLGKLVAPLIITLAPAGWFGFEFSMHRYIRRYGDFTLIRAGK